jgi:hypothetical protein
MVGGCSYSTPDMRVSIRNALLQSFTSYSIRADNLKAESTPSKLLIYKSRSTSTQTHCCSPLYIGCLLFQHKPPVFFDHGPEIGTKEAKTDK